MTNATSHNRPMPAHALKPGDIVLHEGTNHSVQDSYPSGYNRTAVAFTIDGATRTIIVPAERAFTLTN